MADYQIQPQFANLANIRPLAALDVTRGGALEFRPLQRIEIPSARPELVAEGIASALSNIGTSAFGAISAKYKAEKEEQRLKEKYAHEEDVARIKKQGEETPQQKDTRALELFKSKREYLEKHPLPSKQEPKFDIYGNPISQADQNIINARLATVPSGALSKEPDTEGEFPIDGDVLKDEDNVLFSNKQTNNVDLNAPVDVMQGMRESATAQYIPEQKVPQERAEAIAKAVTEQQSLISTQPSDLSVSTGAGPVGVINQPAPELSLTGLKPLLTQEQQANLDVQKQALYSLQPATQFPVTTPQQPIQTIEIGRYTPKTEQEEKEILQKARNLPENTKFEKEEIGTPKRVSYVVKPLTSDEIAQKEKANKEFIIKQKQEEREAAKSAQEMQIRQQKVKDENKILASHAETAATSLKELEDIINIIQKNPGSVGKFSSVISSFPLLDTDSSRVRAKLQTIQGTVALNALSAMRQSSPTGGAVGNVSDKDMELFKATEGTIDPDRATAKDIIPVLQDIYRKRKNIYDESIDILKKNNSEYTPPSISYKTKQEKKSLEQSESEEKVNVISPDGKTGKIPKSQVEKAISQGYRLQ